MEKELVNKMVEFLEDNLELEEIKEYYNSNPTELDFGIVDSGNVDFFPYDMFETLSLMSADTNILNNFEQHMHESGEIQAVTDLTNYYKKLIGLAVKSIINKQIT